MARQLFGTDGIRGKAGEYPLDAATAFGLGAALAEWARAKDAEPRVLVGMDTRESGSWLAAAAGAGLKWLGVEPVFVGVLTTPGVAYLTKTGPYVAGIMISASHNPYEDNGLKIFDHSGFKLPDNVELELEGRILKFREEARGDYLELEEDSGPVEVYLGALRGVFNASLAGLRIVVDCANGAASRLAPKLFESMGAIVYAIADAPDGRNINAGVGALHTEHMIAEVLERKADLGIAFDGDADRAMFASPSGRLVDGDGVLLIAARALQAKGRLPNARVVSTVMSNLGLELALERAGIAMTRTGVGDKYVLEEMVRSGAALGGEQSGHIIFSEYSTTGDGMLTALKVLESVVETGRTLDELVAGLEIFPQRLVNVRIRERKPLDQFPEVQRGIAACEEAFGGEGRVLVRFSGTEPLARVMVEGNDAGLVERHAQSIAKSIELALGA